MAPSFRVFTYFAIATGLAGSGYGQPTNLTLLATASSPTSTANTFCDVQRGDLVQLINTSQPSFLAYDVSNPTLPNQIGATTGHKDHFGPPFFVVNTAFFGMNEIDFAGGYPGAITDQSGDFVSLDVTNFSNVAVLG